MATPEEIKEHAHRFKDGAWRNYSYEELANWVHNLTKRAIHRTEVMKVEKDLVDARNYLAMFVAKFEEHAEQILAEYDIEKPE